jgi:hypothetical protein
MVLEQSEWYVQGMGVAMVNDGGDEVGVLNATMFSAIECLVRRCLQ